MLRSNSKPRIIYTSAVPALDPFVPAAAGATTAAPPRGGHVGPLLQQRRHVCAIICGSRPTRNAELDINWSDGLHAARSGGWHDCISGSAPGRPCNARYSS